MNCPSCGADQPSAAGFCGRCGGSLISPARLAGIAQVSENTPEDWGYEFDAEVQRLAEAGAPFTVYDVLETVGTPEGVHPSAIGARMRRASQRGLVLKMGTAPRASHGDYVTQWRGAPQDA